MRHAGAAAIAVGLAYLTLALLSQGRFGMGDVQLAAVCGLLLGAYGWGVVVVGAILPWLLAGIAAAVLLRAKRIDLDTHLAFAPYLIGGTFLAAVIAASG